MMATCSLYGWDTVTNTKKWSNKRRVIMNHMYILLILISNNTFRVCIPACHLKQQVIITFLNASSTKIERFMQTDTSLLALATSGQKMTMSRFSVAKQTLLPMVGEYLVTGIGYKIDHTCVWFLLEMKAHAFTLQILIQPTSSKAPQSRNWSNIKRHSWRKQFTSI